MEKVEVTPSAMSVQTQKKTPLELAILPPTSPAPLMWMTRTPNPPIDPRSMMTYPESPFPEHQRSAQPDDQDEHSTEA